MHFFLWRLHYIKIFLFMSSIHLCALNSVLWKFLRLFLCFKYVIKNLRKMITLRSKSMRDQDKNQFYIKLFNTCLHNYNKIRKQNSGQFTPFQLISLDKSPFYPWSVSNKHTGFSPAKTDIQEIGQKLKLAKSKYPIGTLINVRRIKGLVQKKSRQSFWSAKNYIVVGRCFFYYFLLVLIIQF